MLPDPVLLYQRFDLTDNCRYIRLAKTHIGCRDAIMFNIRREVFMVWVCRCQIRITGIWKIIVPIQSFTSLVPFVTLRHDYTVSEIQLLPDAQPETL